MGRSIAVRGPQGSRSERAERTFPRDVVVSPYRGCSVPRSPEACPSEAASHFDSLAVCLNSSCHTTAEGS